MRARRDPHCRQRFGLWDALRVHATSASTSGTHTSDSHGTALLCSGHSANGQGPFRDGATHILRLQHACACAMRMVRCVPQTCMTESVAVLLSPPHHSACFAAKACMHLHDACKRVNYTHVRVPLVFWNETDIHRGAPQGVGQWVGWRCHRRALGQRRRFAAAGLRGSPTLRTGLAWLTSHHTTAPSLSTAIA